jgi:hypothetical protein
MARSQRTQAELHADSRTLFYEFDMLCGTSAQLAGLDPTRHRVAYNSTVESFAVHCRALISFFFDFTKAHDTDVIASDFFATPDQWLQDHAIDHYFRAVQVQANKQIAHITTERRNLNTSAGDDGIWRIADIVQAICKLMDEFLTKSPDQNLDPIAKQKLMALVAESLQPTEGPILTAGSRSDPSPGEHSVSMTVKTCP